MILASYIAAAFSLCAGLLIEGGYYGPAASSALCCILSGLFAIALAIKESK